MSALYRRLLSINAPLIVLLFLFYLFRNRGVHYTLVPGLLFAVLMQAAYAANKAITSQEDDENCPGETFSPRAAAALLYVSSAAALLSGGLLFVFYPHSRVLLFSMITFVLFYNQGLLKRVFLFKNAGVTLGFFCYLTLLPDLLVPTPFTLARSAALAVAEWESLIVIFVLTVVLDIRDMPGDRAAGIKTLPVRFGTGPTAAGMSMLIGLVLISHLRAGNTPAAFNTFVILLFSAGSAAPRSRAYYADFIMFEIIFLLLLFVSPLLYGR